MSSTSFTLSPDYCATVQSGIAGKAIVIFGIVKHLAAGKDTAV